MMFLIATGKRQHSQYYRKLLHSNSFKKDAGNTQRLRKIPIKIYENDLAKAQKRPLISGLSIIIMDVSKLQIKTDSLRQRQL
jgi:hypothetical protein